MASAAWARSTRLPVLPPRDIRIITPRALFENDAATKRCEHDRSGCNDWQDLDRVRGGACRRDVTRIGGGRATRTPSQRRPAVHRGGAELVRDPGTARAPAALVTFRRRASAGPPASVQANRSTSEESIPCVRD